MSFNPFIIKAAKAKIVEAGVQVDSQVHIEWTYTQAYGSGRKDHYGRVLTLDDWITVTGSNRTPGTLRMPITMIDKIEVMSSEDEKMGT